MFRLCAFADEASSDCTAQIEALTRNGIKLIEIRGVDGKNVSDISFEEAEKFSQRLTGSGISVWSLGSPLGKTAVSEDIGIALKKAEKLLKLCEIFGCKRIRMFGFYPDSQKKDAEGFDKALERLRVLEAAVGKSDVKLCLENEKGVYGENATECRRILDENKAFGCVFDFANFIQVGQDTITAYELLGGSIDYFHIKDALSSGKVVPAGCGDGKLEEILAAFPRDAVLSIEPHLEVFAGFEKLEKENVSIDKSCYGSSGQAFDAAVAAIKRLLIKIGCHEEDGIWMR